MGDPGGGASQSARPPPLKKNYVRTYFLLTGAFFSMWKVSFTPFWKHFSLWEGGGGGGGLFSFMLKFI